MTGEWMDGGKDGKAMSADGVEVNGGLGWERVNGLLGVL